MKPTQNKPYPNSTWPSVTVYIVHLVGSKFYINESNWWVNAISGHYYCSFISWPVSWKPWMTRCVPSKQGGCISITFMIISIRQSFRLIDIDIQDVRLIGLVTLKILDFHSIIQDFHSIIQDFRLLLYNKSKNLDYQSENPGFSNW